MQHPRKLCSQVSTSGNRFLKKKFHLGIPFLSAGHHPTFAVTTPGAVEREALAEARRAVLGVPLGMSAVGGAAASPGGGAASRSHGSGAANGGSFGCRVRCLIKSAWLVAEALARPVTGPRKTERDAEAQRHFKGAADSSPERVPPKFCRAGPCTASPSSSPGTSPGRRRCAPGEPRGCRQHRAQLKGSGTNLGRCGLILPPPARS